jgi:serine/threonine-protein kinase
MGEIYRATDSTLGRAVAIKVLARRYAQDEDVRARFTREALAAARLSGAPHVVTIFDVGEWEERPFIVMEYLAGGSLNDAIQRHGAQPAGQALEWLDQAALALDAAHAEGVVHRDVKPANLLLDRDGNVHVADFGIASAAGMDSLTQTGTVLGTAGYLSPEQAQGERATPASDRYALGVVAFELLTGTRPFTSESTTAEAAAHVHQPVPSISERSEELPSELDRVFERALAKDPAARYPTAGEFVADLRGALHDAAGRTQVVSPTVPPPEPVTEPLRRKRGRSPLLWLLLGLLALGAIAGGIVAAVLAGGDGGGQARTVVKTVTTQGATKTVQVTTTAPAPTTAATSPPSAESGAALNDRGFALMQAGDYANALPILEQALAKLDGTGSLTEAYTDYNVAFTRLQLGRCDGVIELLDESESIQGHRKEIDRARKQAKKQCD